MPKFTASGSTVAPFPVGNQDDDIQAGREELLGGEGKCLEEISPTLGEQMWKVVERYYGCAIVENQQLVKLHFGVELEDCVLRFVQPGPSHGAGAIQQDDNLLWDVTSVNSAGDGAQRGGDFEGIWVSHLNYLNKYD